MKTQHCNCLYFNSKKTPTSDIFISTLKSNNKKPEIIHIKAIFLKTRNTEVFKSKENKDFELTWKQFLKHTHNHPLAIDLSNSREAVTEGLHKLIEHCPQLEELTLSSLSGNVVLQSIQSCINKHPDLIKCIKTLNLVNMSLDSDSLASILKSTSLEKLSITQEYVQSKKLNLNFLFKKLAEEKAKLSLSQLELIHCKISDDYFEYIVDTCPHLKEITLTSYELRDKGIIRLLLNNPNLISLQLIDCILLHPNSFATIKSPNIKVLKFDRTNKLSLESIKQLAQNYPNLESLKFDINSLDFERLSQIMQIITKKCFNFKAIKIFSYKYNQPITSLKTLIEKDYPRIRFTFDEPRILSMAYF